MKQSKPKKNFPRLIIERIGYEADGRIAFLDIHDEKFGEAIFFQNSSRHYHGQLNQGKYNKEV